MNLLSKKRLPNNILISVRVIATAIGLQIGGKYTASPTIHSTALNTAARGSVIFNDDKVKLVVMNRT